MKSEHTAQVAVQPPNMASLLSLYFPVEHAVHVPTVHVLVSVCSLGDGHSHPVRYEPSAQPRWSHGVWL